MFSVIIPVYNNANTISRAIKSVVQQSFKEYEIIIVDDGSTDEIEKQLSKYSSQIRVFKQENKGVSSARNLGVSKSRGEFICFLDADDEWMPIHLEKLMDAIKKYPKEVFFSTLFKTINKDLSIKSKLAYLKDYEKIVVVDDYFKMMLDFSHVFINTDTVCISKKVLLDEPFVVGEKKGEDTDLWYRLAAYHNLVLITDETALYHQEDSTATKDGMNPQDWYFAKREEKLLADNSIDISKRKHISELIERWRCACIRDALRDGNKKKAKIILKQLRKPFYLRSIFSRIMYYLPSALSKWIIEMI